MARTHRNARRWLIALGTLWIVFFGAVVGVMVTRGDDAPVGFNGAAAQADEVADDEAHAEEAVAPGDGWFTEEQVSGGSDAYARHCASCHGGDLEGGVGPALASETFWDRWEGDEVHALFQIISETMPQDDPGSLATDTYADVTAFILEINGFPTGDADLPADEDRLRELTIDRSAAEGVAEHEDDAAASEAETEGDPDAGSADEDAAAEPADEDAAPSDPDGQAATADGWYTDEQAQRGQEAYAQHCARCHADDLQGNPPLEGDAFLSNHQTVAALFDYARETMPFDDPGSLQNATYADVVTYILRENGFPADDEELDPSARDEMEAMELAPEAAQSGSDDAEPTGQE
jgi:mono/diheme cytochrome c family protein